MESILVFIFSLTLVSGADVVDKKLKKRDSLIFENDGNVEFYDGYIPLPPAITELERYANDYGYVDRHVQPIVNYNGRYISSDIETDDGRFGLIGDTFLGTPEYITKIGEEIGFGALNIASVHSNGLRRILNNGHIQPSNAKGIPREREGNIGGKHITENRRAVLGGAFSRKNGAGVNKSPSKNIEIVGTKTVGDIGTLLTESKRPNSNETAVNTELKQLNLSGSRDNSTKLMAQSNDKNNTTSVFSGKTLSSRISLHNTSTQTIVDAPTPNISSNNVGYPSNPLNSNSELSTGESVVLTTLAGLSTASLLQQGPQPISYPTRIFGLVPTPYSEWRSQSFRRTFG